MTVISNTSTHAVLGLEAYQNAFRGIEGALSLTGPLAEAALDFHFENASLHDDLELNLIFPLALDAVLLGVDLMLNGSRLTGRILKVKRAEQRYEEAISDGDTPIMVEPLAENHFRIQLGNLMPGEQATVTIRYAQLLTPKSGQLRFVLPTTIAPRYGAAPHSAGLPLLPENNVFVEYPISLRVKTDPLIITDLACPSVAAVISKRAFSSGSEALPLAPGEFIFNSFMNRDLVLTWSSPAESSHALVIDAKQPTLLVQFRLPVPQALCEPSQALTLKVLIDCSGSMAGSSIAAAREGALHALSQLREGEEFAVGLFGSSIQPLTDGLKTWNELHRSVWYKALSDVNADLGGTEIESALSHMLSIGSSSPADILIITDGHVSDIKAIIEQLKMARHRVFAVGVGSAPAESMLSALAEASGGECALVSPGEDLGAAIDRLMTRMRTPRINHLKAVLNGVEASWLSPLSQSCPITQTHTLFAQIAAGEWNGHLTVSGELGGETHSWELKSRPETTSASAAQKLIAFERYKALPPKLQTDYALDQQLLTQGTRLLCIHERIPTKKAGSFPVLEDIPHMPLACLAITADRMEVARLPMFKLRMDTDPNKVSLQIYESRWYQRLRIGKASTPERLLEWLNAASDIDDLVVRIETMELEGLPRAFREALKDSDLEIQTKHILGWLALLSDGRAEGPLAQLLSRHDVASRISMEPVLILLRGVLSKGVWLNLLERVAQVTEEDRV